MLDQDGRHLGTLRLGKATASCAFAAQGPTLYVTTSGAIYRVRL